MEPRLDIASIMAVVIIMLEALVQSAEVPTVGPPCKYG